MGRGSFLASFMVATAKAVVRENQRENRKRNRIAQQEKIRESAEEEVKQQDLRIQTITSFHKECSHNTQWHVIAKSPEPKKPVYLHSNESKARSIRERYKPNFLTKLLCLGKFRVKTLEKAIELGKQEDDYQYNASKAEFEEKHKLWEKNTKFAQNILNGDLRAYESAIKHLRIWKEINSK